MPEKHDRTAESHARVSGRSKKNFGGGSYLMFKKYNFFFLLHTQDVGSYIMHEKHDRTAESHAGVLGQKKKNFFSSSTYTGWGGEIFAHPDIILSIE